MVERNALAAHAYAKRSARNALADHMTHWNSYSAVPGPFNRQAALDTAAVGLSPVPVLGDLAGLGADAHMYWNEPESRTWGNALMTGVSIVPGVPNAAMAGTLMGLGAIKKLGGSLPMDEVSRLARAREQGFTTDAYHGTVTKHDIENFERYDRRGRRIESFFVTEENKNFANGFAEAEQGRVIPVKINKEGFLDTRIPKHKEDFERILSERGLTKGVDWKYAKRESGDPVLPGWGNQTVIDAVNDAGYPGMLIQERPWMESVAVFDPSRVRSRFAKFDPRQISSGNLLAGAAAGSMALNGMARFSDDK